MSASAGYAAAVETLINETYYTLAAFALLAFEYFITLDREARLVWDRKATGATVLFVLNRYWLFFQYITQVITTYPLSQKLFLTTRRCEVVGYMVIVGNGGPPFVWAAFSTLRGYALSGRKWWVAPLIFVFYVPDIILNCIYYSKLVPVALSPPFNCLLSNGLPESTWVHFTIAGRVCLIAGDLVVLIVTWSSTFGITRAANAAKVQMSLTNAILKDGTCLLILNVVNIIVNAVPNNSAVSAFQDPITSILVSRFLLNLRDTFTSGEDETRPSFVRSYRGRTTATTVQFADFVDPMGADLDHGISASHDSLAWSDWGCESTTGNELASFATMDVQSRAAKGTHEAVIG
ncbi:hypothetical protein BV20DRAFT_968519 [Pilatotrama ljubarskyi]|nr:hypothetical protein BV20DRAFT_968519 [Pilatotrama ljubarskyi]